MVNPQPFILKTSKQITQDFLSHQAIKVLCKCALKTMKYLKNLCGKSIGKFTLKIQSSKLIQGKFVDLRKVGAAAARKGKQYILIYSVHNTEYSQK